MAQDLHIYLHSPWRAEAEAGRVNFFERLRGALPDWRLHFHPDTQEERDQAAQRGYGLFHMQEPTSDLILCLRKAYHFPFWRIETTNERWNFDVARATFDPSEVTVPDARAFMQRWRPKIFRDGPVSHEGFVFVPLQGRISDHRSFQSASPLAMLETVLRQDPARPVRATLHPKETYTERDHAALAALGARFPRFKLVRDDAKDLLATCDHVVTQNSGVALTGYFAGKQAVLFAGSDFHHIAGSVPRDGVDAAFARMRAMPPRFGAYLWWFFKRHSINGGAPDCDAQIAARLRHHGWPI